MNQKTIPVGCALTKEEYRKFKEICERNGTYPSAAVRFAINLYMRIAGGENLEGNAITYGEESSENTGLDR